MVYFLAGCAVLVLLLFAGRIIASANPSNLAVAFRRIGGVAAIAAAGFLILRGALALGIPLAVFGFSLLRRGSGFGFGDPFGRARKAPGQKSQVKTDRLEVALDHDTGEMEGKCLSGRFAGRALSSSAIARRWSSLPSSIRKARRKPPSWKPISIGACQIGASNT